MVYIVKMITDSKRQRYAFGRIFSGTITRGQKALVVGPHHRKTLVYYIKFKFVKNLL